MSKPETYKGTDAVKVKCLRDYEVQDGTDDPVKFEEGKTYSVAPRSAAHLLRKRFNMRDEKTGKYIGDGDYFIDPTPDVVDEPAPKKATKPVLPGANDKG